jgi:hypothetical protein
MRRFLVDRSTDSMDCFNLLHEQMFEDEKHVEKILAVSIRSVADLHCAARAQARCKT